MRKIFITQAHVLEIEFFKTCKRTMGELLNPDFEKNCQFFISMCLMMLTVKRIKNETSMHCTYFLLLF